MNIRTRLITFSLIAASLITGAAQAALIGRDLNGSLGSFEAYYDDDLNITWLANANVNGVMTWSAANTWAANLSFTDGVNTYDNWRLPTCDGFNCAYSEMAHLFYSELGGTTGQSILTSSDSDLAKFTNLQSNIYWSDKESGPGYGVAWYFDFSYGTGDEDLVDSNFSALAVSPGDVGATNGVPDDVAAVPEPATLLLVGLGLLGLAVARRRG